MSIPTKMFEKSMRLALKTCGIFAQAAIIVATEEATTIKKIQITTKLNTTDEQNSKGSKLILSDQTPIPIPPKPRG